MTAVSQDRPARREPAPCLTVAPSFGPVISILLVVAVALFLFGLVAL